MLSFASERRLVERLRGIFGSGKVGAVDLLDDSKEDVGLPPRGWTGLREVLSQAAGFRPANERWATCAFLPAHVR